MLDKTYDPKEIEARRYPEWENSGAFRAHPESPKQPYCIVIPPPNVTGSLHMGHALDNTLQDVLIRWRRMKGDDVLWQPGTDHAGIATQMVVVRNLEQEGIGLAVEGAARNDANKKLLNREEFLARVWEWKAYSGGTITSQLRRLGASCDWSRERFTMDEGLSKAVLKVFVELYREGLIYKDLRLVNWDPKMLTAISDLEVESREVKGHLWYFKYPIEGSPDEFIVVATTRPETMLGDTGIAVHPDDPKWKHLIGRHAVLPLVGRRIAIVGDEYSDPEKGSGAVKITPAHDFNDFEVGRRHNLEAINIFDKFARVNDKAPEKYRGLDRFEARKIVVAEMEELGLVEKIEPHTHAVPYGDRGGVPVEPYLTEQWYADAKKLAEAPLAAARDGRVKFVPERGREDFFRWMENIEPWCVSRQLWWGHQIPAWYGPDKKVFVALSEEEAKAEARAHYGRDVELERDPDVLDTWFSSALWPFSTLGWPDQTPEVAKYYPTSTLVTGWDILFFWVARMMMMGMHFMKEVPFRTVYLHGLVTDEKGQKMSKSKGNVIDPLELIDKYGADALRFTMTSLAASQAGRLRLAPARVEGARNFATKLWNATRFAEMNGAALPKGFDPASARLTVNKWMLGELARANQAIDKALTDFRLNEAANTLYEFVWGVVCDWYVELTKPIVQGADGPEKDETRAVTAFVLRETVKLMHPVMPFITEELWDKLGHRAEHGPLIGQPWPAPTAVDAAADAEMGWLVKLIQDIRSARAELNVPAGAKLKLLVIGGNDTTAARLETHRPAIERLARIEGVEAATSAPKASLQIVVGEATYALPVGDVIDLKAESARLQKEIKKLADEVGKIDAKLANAAFVARAPEEVVEEQRERRAQAEQTGARLSAALERLGV
ncbi:MAG: valine--tRNA ligase [Rhodospirillales bacterium 24-66-33]|jgi:valyl-tRNA synthetase|uniref:valine--tRNA ligase n=3 Tax=Reyranella sp. TaxID=1929291 RepID=UPI000BD99B29|nr:valine--tRNA ligase [Reyranella sp.]OYY45784.1 MAG: valine--tRNA ligase [Rhodospirillales bacterium 35-66-84]OYZ96165.1 MAG: valine--tRNA ligase [Rhodospirillales bacterium 24-66-33]OZB28673.1 MAG: valine--tRNA ligase [Rhodospirillales bacterium 39-66-50]HQS14097.1 valine--tRNA ligase [Reyranella sp.]HQT11093.1 valine--tRNA ligase [Reyranella sp.]